MTRVTITYLMENAQETAETCITLPMRDEFADSLTKHGIYDERGGIRKSVRPLITVLTNIANMQGYRLSRIEKIEKEHV